MQPRYEIRWSDEFIADVTAICGELRIFDEAFAGYDYYLTRLPRGPGTWDLSPLGDIRLARLAASRLEDGTDVPTIVIDAEAQFLHASYFGCSAWVCQVYNCG